MFLDRFIGKKSYSDKDILVEIRKGNKDILVYLFEETYREAGKFILKTGGKESDIGKTLHEVIVYFWQIAQDESFVPAGQVREVITQSGMSLWARQKEINPAEAEISTGLDIKVPIPDSPYDPWFKRLKLLSDNMRLMSQSGKEVVYYTYFENWSDKKIAEHMDLSGEQEVADKRMKTLDKYENILLGSYVKRDLID